MILTNGYKYVSKIAQSHQLHVHSLHIDKSQQVKLALISYLSYNVPPMETNVVWRQYAASVNSVWCAMFKCKYLISRFIQTSTAHS